MEGKSSTRSGAFFLLANCAGRIPRFWIAKKISPNYWKVAVEWG